MDIHGDYLLSYMYYIDEDLNTKFVTQVFFFDNNFNFKLRMTLPTFENEFGRLMYS